MRYKKNIKSNSVIILVLSVLSLAVYSCDKFKLGASTQGGVKLSMPFGGNYNYSDIPVTRAVDGDTLVLAGGEKVRLIGIDTPEMHESNKLQRDARRSGQDVAAIQALGRRAYEFTRNLVEGKRVRLEFDIERHDKYGRLLAYVYLKDDTFVNAKIVEEGFASLMTIPPNVKFSDLFAKFYKEARENNRGLWR